MHVKKPSKNSSDAMKKAVSAHIQGHIAKGLLDTFKFEPFPTSIQAVVLDAGKPTLITGLTNKHLIVGGPISGPGSPMGFSSDNLIEEALEKAFKAAPHKVHYGFHGSMPIIAIGPHGGKIIGYTGLHEPIYAGSAAAIKLQSFHETAEALYKHPGKETDAFKHTLVKEWLSHLGVSATPSALGPGDVLVPLGQAKKLETSFFGLHQVKPGVFHLKDLIAFVGKPLVPQAHEHLDYGATMAAGDSDFHAFPKDLSTLKEIEAGKYAGSHSNKLFQAPNGKKYIFKAENPTIARAEEAVSRIARLVLGEGKVQDAKYVQLAGQDGVLIAAVEDASPLGPEHKTTPPATKKMQTHFEDIVEQHALDWLVSNHDAHGENFLIQGDKLVGIDKGQAWKFVGKDQLSADYNPNASSQIYKFFWDQVKSGQIKGDPLPTLQKFFGKLQQISDEQFKAIVGPYVSLRAGMSDLDASIIEDKLVARFHEAKSNWEWFLGKIYPYHQDAKGVGPQKHVTINTSAVAESKPTPIIAPAAKLVVPLEAPAPPPPAVKDPEVKATIESPSGGDAFSAGTTITLEKKNITGKVHLQVLGAKQFKLFFSDAKYAALSGKTFASPSSAGDHVWVVGQGFTDVEDYKKKTGKTKIASGAGWKYWGVKPGEETKVLEQAASAPKVAQVPAQPVEQPKPVVEPSTTPIDKPVSAAFDVDDLTLHQLENFKPGTSITWNSAGKFMQAVKNADGAWKLNGGSSYGAPYLQSFYKKHGNQTVDLSYSPTNIESVLTPKAPVLTGPVLADSYDVQASDASKTFFNNLKSGTTVAWLEHEPETNLQGQQTSVKGTDGGWLTSWADGTHSTMTSEAMASQMTEALGDKLLYQPAKYIAPVSGSELNTITPSLEAFESYGVGSVLVANTGTGNVLLVKKADGDWEGDIAHKTTSFTNDDLLNANGSTFSEVDVKEKAHKPASKLVDIPGWQTVDKAEYNNLNFWLKLPKGTEVSWATSDGAWGATLGDYEEGPWKLVQPNGKVIYKPYGTVQGWAEFATDGQIGIKKPTAENNFETMPEGTVKGKDANLPNLPVGTTIKYTSIDTLEPIEVTKLNEHKWQWKYQDGYTSQAPNEPTYASLANADLTIILPSATEPVWEKLKNPHLPASFELLPIGTILKQESSTHSYSTPSFYTKTPDGKWLTGDVTTPFSSSIMSSDIQSGEYFVQKNGSSVLATEALKGQNPADLTGAQAKQPVQVTLNFMSAWAFLPEVKQYSSFLKLKPNSSSPAHYNICLDKVPGLSPEGLVTYLQDLSDKYGIKPAYPGHPKSNSYGAFMTVKASDLMATKISVMLPASEVPPVEVTPGADNFETMPDPSPEKIDLSGHPKKLFKTWPESKKMEALKAYPIGTLVTTGNGAVFKKLSDISWEVQGQNGQEGYEYSTYAIAQKIKYQNGGVASAPGVAVPVPKVKKKAPIKIVKTQEQLDKEAKAAAITAWAKAKPPVTDKDALEVLSHLQYETGVGAFYARIEDAHTGTLVIGNGEDGHVFGDALATAINGPIEAIATPLGTLYKVKIEDLKKVYLKDPVTGPDGKTYPAGTTFKTQTLTNTTEELLKGQPGFHKIVSHLSKSDAMMVKWHGKDENAKQQLKQAITDLGIKIPFPDPIVGAYNLLTEVPKAELAKLHTKTLTTPIIPKQPPAFMAKGVSGGSSIGHESSTNNRADLAAIKSLVPGKFGYTLRFGTDGILRNHQLTFRKVQDPSGSVFYEFQGELREFKDNKAKGLSTDSYHLRTAFTKKDPITGKYTHNYNPETGLHIEDAATMQSLTAKTGETSGGASVAVLTGVYTFRNTFVVRVPVNGDPEKELAEAFAMMGEDPHKAMAMPTEDDERIFKKLALVRAYLGNDGWNDKYADKFNDESWLDDKIKSFGVEHKLTDLHIVNSVGDSQSVYANDLEELKEALPTAKQPKWVYQGVHQDSPYYQILEGFGPSSKKLQRLNGANTSGQSVGADMGSGASGMAMLRVNNSSLDGLDWGLHCSDVKMVFHPRVLNRLDWYLHDTDTYGVSNPNDGHYQKALPRNKALSVSSSANEICFEHGVSYKDMAGIICHSDVTRKEIISKFKKAGMGEVNGIDLEEFVVVVPSSRNADLVVDKLVGLHEGVLQ